MFLDRDTLVEDATRVFDATPVSGGGGILRRFLERRCARPGCEHVFEVHKQSPSNQRFCSQTCRQRAYWDSGQGPAARKAHVATGAPVVPRGTRETKVVAPRVPAPVAHPPVVNTHVAGSMVRAMLCGERTITTAHHHSSVRSNL